MALPPRARRSSAGATPDVVPLLTAELRGAAEALRIGLVAGSRTSRVRTSQRAPELAKPIARQAPLGVQGTLANARAGRGRGPDAGARAPLALLPGVLRGRDAAEGLRSFTERRGSRFTGH